MFFRRSSALALMLCALAFAFFCAGDAQIRTANEQLAPSSCLSDQLALIVPQKYQADVAGALKLAGSNRPEIENALRSAPADQRTSMSFLVATMVPEDLASASAGLLLEHVEYAHRARREFKYMKDMPDDVFLHYVVPFRCTAEPLEQYRKYFYDQIYPYVKDAPTLADAAQAVNMWLGTPDKDGRARVRFVSTEHRDQGPFETLRSGFGRCGEETVIFVAAARSVGVPTRNAWTPYWTICDNNHAWVEIWSGGKWFHVGSCEPNPNGVGNAWFTAVATRAAIVLSSCTGIPDDINEPVYRKFTKSCLINSIQSYSYSCDLEMTVLNPDGTPRPGIRVFFNVFNWGGFKPIVSAVTGTDGVAKLTCGIGTYMLCAGDAEVSAWRMINTTKGKTSVTMKLAKDAAPDGYFQMVYPTPNDANEWLKANIKEREEMTARMGGFKIPERADVKTPPETHSYDEFAPEKDAEFWALVKGTEFEPAALAAMKDAGGNWKQLAAAVKLAKPERRADALWLICAMPHFDRIRVSTDIMLDHLNGAHDIKAAAKYKVPEDLFRFFIVYWGLPDPQQPSVHASVWRARLLEIARPLMRDTVAATALEANKWVAANLKDFPESNERGSYPADPGIILTMGGGDPYDMLTFTLGLLRTLGIPARPKATWVEYYDGSAWLPLYPRTPEDIGKVKEKDEAVRRAYLPSGGIKLQATRNGQAVALGETVFSVAEYNNGLWAPLDTAYDLNNGWSVLQPGRYLLTAGVRNQNGDVFAFAKQVFVESEKGTIVEVPLDPSPEFLREGDMIKRGLDAKADLSMLDIGTVDQMVFSDNVILFFFAINDEPSVRMFPMLEACLDTAVKSDTSVFAVLEDSDRSKLSADSRFNKSSMSILVDSQRKALMQLIPEKELSQAGLMPVVIMLEKGTGKVLYWKEGYNLNLKQEVEYALAKASGVKVPPTAVPVAKVSQVDFKATPNYSAMADEAYGMKKYPEAIELYRKAIEAYPESAKLMLYNIACSYALAGDKDNALSSLKQAVDAGYAEIDWINKDPDMDILRDDDRFKAIMESLKR